MYHVKEIAYRKTKLISPGAFAGDISHEIESANVDNLEPEVRLSSVQQHTKSGSEPTCSTEEEVCS